MPKAAGGGLYEVEVARMAASKAKNADVKAYAEMLNSGGKMSMKH